MLSYGCLCAITTVVFDGFGTASLWWGYPIKLIPLIPPYFPVDIVLIPIWFMILYQLFSRNFKAFLIANIIQATTFSCVFEPLFAWLDLYKLNTWKFSYSFLYYIIVANFFRWLMLKMKTVQVK
ncbi:CBO0543 family protein [Ectobacillus funiculus]|uniref:CBO0543 family protein n=1 Tax=Ectobacillus funiculus TaxID=137993 RepID=UPI00397CB7EA